MFPPPAKLYFLLQSEEVTYAQLTLPRGGNKGYSPMIKQSKAGGGQGQGTIYAKIDNSRSLFSGLLSPGSVSISEPSSRSNACFSGPGLVEEEEQDTMTPLVGNSGDSAHVVIYSGPETGQRGPRAETLVISRPSSSRESKV